MLENCAIILYEVQDIMYDVIVKYSVQLGV